MRALPPVLLDYALWSALAPVLGAAFALDAGGDADPPRHV